MRRSITTILLASVAALTPVAAIAAEPMDVATPSVSPDATKAPMVLGAFLPGPGGAARRITRYVAKTRRPPGIVAFHAAWGGAFRTFYEDGIKSYMQEIVDAGAVPMLTWEPWAGKVDDTRYALRRIITPAFCPTSTAVCSGRFDVYIRTFARQMGEWLQHPESKGTRVLIRLAHEMNGRWMGWSRWHNGNTTAEYRAFWRYVVFTIREVLPADVRSRVKWVWAPNEPGGGTVALKKVYPGGRWVDYLGFSAYNWGRAVSWGTWRSMKLAYRRPVAQLSALSATKPIIVSETGSVEKGGNKARWITSGFRMLRTTYPKIVALIWYDFIDPRGLDWRVNSSRASRTAYRKVVSSTFYKGLLPS